MSQFTYHAAPETTRISGYIVGALTTALVVLVGFVSLAQFTV